MVERPFLSLECNEIQIAVFGTQEVLVNDQKGSVVEECDTLLIGALTQRNLGQATFTEAILLKVSDQPGLAKAQQNEFFLVRAKVGGGNPPVFPDLIACDFDTVQQLRNMLTWAIGDLVKLGISSE